jgi:hypothetical protein
MDHSIYVFIEENNIRCYPNLRQLAENHGKVPYFYTLKLLKKKSIVIRKDYTVAVTRMKWKTKRGFGKQTQDNDYD